MTWGAKIACVREMEARYSLSCLPDSRVGTSTRCRWKPFPRESRRSATARQAGLSQDRKNRFMAGKQDSPERGKAENYLGMLHQDGGISHLFFSLLPGRRMACREVSRHWAACWRRREELFCLSGRVWRRKFGGMACLLFLDGPFSPGSGDQKHTCEDQQDGEDFHPSEVVHAPHHRYG